MLSAFTLLFSFVMLNVSFAFNLPKQVFLKPPSSRMFLSTIKSTSFHHNVPKLCMSNTQEKEDYSGYLAVGVSGTIANLICDYSIYVLKTTSCGLPPGPFGLEGAAEGISYLGVVGILIWSLVTKVQTGRGLPVGRFGLLGLAEGLTYLTVIGGIVVAGLNLQEYGFLPGFLPNDNCFGIND